MCKGFEEDRESDIAAADIQIFEFLQSGHRMIKEQEGLYVRYGDFQAFFTQASVDRARLVAENAAQAERIKEMEERPLIPAGANVTVHFPPMPESELVSHLQNEIIHLHKEIHRLRGHRLPSEYFPKEAHND